MYRDDWLLRCLFFFHSSQVVFPALCQRDCGNARLGFRWLRGCLLFFDPIFRPPFSTRITPRKRVKHLRFQSLPPLGRARPAAELSVSLSQLSVATMMTIWQVGNREVYMRSPRIMMSALFILFMFFPQARSLVRPFLQLVSCSISCYLLSLGLFPRLLSKRSPTPTT